MSLERERLTDVNVVNVELERIAHKKPAAEAEEARLAAEEIEQERIATEEAANARPNSEYYSVALIGSLGGRTATLGHTNPIKLITTAH